MSQISNLTHGWQKLRVSGDEVSYVDGLQPKKLDPKHSSEIF